MKFIFEKLGGAYTLSEDGMLYPNLAIEAADRPNIPDQDIPLILQEIGEGE